MSGTSTRLASLRAAVGAEFMVPGPWPAGSGTSGAAGLAADAYGGQGAGQGGQAEPDLRITELHFRELHFRELHVREVRAGARGARPGGADAVRAHQARAREIRVRQSQRSEPLARARGPQPADARRPHARPAGARPVAARSAGARPAGGPAPVRLTRRGRLAVAGLAVLAATAVLVLLWLSAAGGAQASSHGQPAGAGFQGMTKVVVRPGQTLWSIAASAEPSANPWVVIQQIIDANALSGISVYAGEPLWVPKG